MSLAAYEQSLRQRAALERRAFVQRGSLAQGAHDKATLREQAILLQKQTYEDMIEERSVGLWCGYPLCGNRLPPPEERRAQSKYRVSRTNQKMFDTTSSRRFCSIECTKGSKVFAAQLSDEPLHLRSLSTPPHIIFFDELDEHGEIRQTPEPPSVETISEGVSEISFNENEAFAQLTPEQQMEVMWADAVMSAQDVTASGQDVPGVSDTTWIMPSTAPVVQEIVERPLDANVREEEGGLDSNEDEDDEAEDEEDLDEFGDDDDDDVEAEVAAALQSARPTDLALVLSYILDLPTSATYETLLRLGAPPAPPAPVSGSTPDADDDTTKEDSEKATQEDADDGWELPSTESKVAEGNRTHLAADTEVAVQQLRIFHAHIQRAFTPACVALSIEPSAQILDILYDVARSLQCKHALQCCRRPQDWLCITIVLLVVLSERGVIESTNVAGGAVSLHMDEEQLMSLVSGFIVCMDQGNVHPGLVAHDFHPPVVEILSTPSVIGAESSNVDVSAPLQ